MNTKLLMTASAIVLGLCGFLFEFLPHEVLTYSNLPTSGGAPVFVQITGSLYLGFAILNWMARSVTIGGIYGRPLAMGNCTHFLVGSLALLKYAIASNVGIVVWTGLVIYSIFAMLFGYLFAAHSPTRDVD